MKYCKYKLCKYEIIDSFEGVWYNILFCNKLVCFDKKCFVMMLWIFLIVSNIII